MLMPFMKVQAPTTAHMASIPAKPESLGAALTRPDPQDLRAKAVQKVLEMLDSHVLGGEPLPRQTLLRLLETLSKALSLQPLPQESLRDFGNRLALAIENLPAAGRYALEKALAQRSLALPVRAVVALLRPPAAEAQPRAAQATVTRAAQGRASPAAAAAPPSREGPPVSTLGLAATKQPEPRLPSAMPAAAGPQAPLSARTPPLPQAPSAVLEAAGGELQRAVRTVFGVDDTEGLPAGTAENNISERSHDLHEALQMPQAEDDGKPATVTPAAAQRLASARDGENDIPLMRTAIAFLATDPDALAQANTLATPAVSDDLRAILVEELHLDVAESRDNSTDGQERPMSNGSDAQRKDAVASSLQQHAHENDPAAERPATMQGPMDRAETAKAETVKADAAKTEPPAGSLAVRLGEMSVPLSQAEIGTAPVARRLPAQAFADDAARDAQGMLAGIADGLEEGVEMEQAGRPRGGSTAAGDLSDKEPMDPFVKDGERGTAARPSPAPYDAGMREGAVSPRLADILMAQAPVAFMMIPYQPAGEFEGVAPEEEDGRDRDDAQDEDDQERRSGEDKRQGQDEAGDEPGDDNHGTLHEW